MPSRETSETTVRTTRAPMPSRFRLYSEITRAEDDDDNNDDDDSDVDDDE